MTENSNKINQLFHDLEDLLKRQDVLSKDIINLRIEIERIKSAESKKAAEPEEVKQVDSEKRVEPEVKQEKAASYYEYQKQLGSMQSAGAATFSNHKSQKGKSNIEKFIGENLINKIGIAITVIGVGIGAKYAIDHHLISPLTRIILGYLFAFGLLGISIKLKRNYESFSAVLLSGAMAILYFITYSAYSFYGLIPQFFAFALMVIFTTFTVAAAITYNMQVIAHIGLVGAYAVPFLLSEGSGKVAILFLYMAIINTGILVIAFKKYWKSLYYSAFCLTWLIFFSWYLSKYHESEHFSMTWAFLFTFFLTFYLTSLAYKLLQKEKFGYSDIVLLLSNSFIFYGIGYDILNNSAGGGQLLGLFTVGNAIVHFCLSVMIYRQKLADRDLFYLVAGLVLVFITIAIPIQLDGNWVTLLWTGLSVVLFWIGRSRRTLIYERLSYPLMILAFSSLIHDWMIAYPFHGVAAARFRPLINIHFLTSILFSAAFGYISILSRKPYDSGINVSPGRISRIMSYAVPGILLFSLYYAFRLEIGNYWERLYSDSVIRIKPESEFQPGYVWNIDMLRYKTIWLINYSLLFFSVLSFANMLKYKNEQLLQVSSALMVLTLAFFLSEGLYALSELRESYLKWSPSSHYNRDAFNLWVRYVSFAFVFLTIIALRKNARLNQVRKDYKIGFEGVLHVSIVWIASSELINWMDIAGSSQSYKLGLSILWGMYSLFLIILGILKKKKYLRMGAIVLFGITLFKLFLYDISHLGTIAKTVVFVSLGILLLIISFLYNKYKHVIFEEIKS